MAGRGTTTHVWAPIRRIWPLALLAAGFLIVIALGLDDYLSLEALRREHRVLADWVARNEVGAVVAYLAIYTSVVALSLPGAAVMTICGGLLFGTLAGTVYAVAAAAVGAGLVFLAARHAVGSALTARIGGAARRMEAGFRRHALSYLIFLRLMPLFPFWLVNLVPAVLGVPFRVFMLGTLLGIIPGTLIFAGIGGSLAAVFSAGGAVDADLLVQPRVLLPLAGLSLLSLLPPLAGWWQGRRRRPTPRGG